jgi:CIC family chloride channel protein
MGYFVPEVMGVGYNQVEKVLNGDMVFQFVALLAVLKIVATAVCYSSGNAGGIFGPSLFIGAMIGGSVGSVAHRFFPAYTAGPGAYALVGMGTAFAGIVRTPLTSVIMIFEMTRDYTIIVPLMISNLIAFFISQRLQKEPIYEALAHQDGVHLPTAESRFGHGTRVAELMRPASTVLAADSVAESALAVLQQQTPRDQALDAWPVADAHGLRGMVRRADLVDAAANGKTATRLADLENSVAESNDFAHLHPDHSLSQALERMGKTSLHVLPVVSRANMRNLLGIVALDDVLKAYGVTPGSPASEVATPGVVGGNVAEGNGAEGSRAEGSRE